MKIPLNTSIKNMLKKKKATQNGDLRI
jgi:hypothetical protein